MSKFAKYPSLEGRVVFVTGGATGIGAEIVRAFAGQGCKVGFVDILDQEGEAIAAETGAAFVNCDVTDVAGLRAAIDVIRNRLGNITVLVNNAANDDRHEIDAVTEEYWDASLDLNLRPQFFAAQAVREQMKAEGGGSIINFSSIAWRGGASNMPVYATAKSATIGLTRALGRGFGTDNIRVNAIEPGAVITERQKRLWFKDQADIDSLVARQTIQKMLLGDEIARTVLFLASDDSRMITKQSITVDAGLR
ncbi:MAG: SDR family oxidoreductase [Devosia sp.]|uniref:SDR family NAD(P)-dependent oxidoreductase n=1 Tax=Devosia sp. TaxID=1871048 RepID=UPI001AC9064A|nr:SDR family oxidoreductase [Devosia sp.]MBN9316859.1 SDR family oxidoreductase [Devosia sp.]